MTPKLGMRFKHSRVLDSDKKPALYQVTRIANGLIYYRNIIDPGNRTALGTPACCHLEEFDKRCLEVIPEEKSPEAIAT
jgi:hypothetical protein